VNSNSPGSFVGRSISSTGIIGSAARIAPGRQDRAITASTIKNVSMTYVPRDIEVIVPVPRGASAQNCSQSTIESAGDTPLPAALDCRGNARMFSVVRNREGQASDRVKLLFY
jgi:hypothetical protein